MPYRDDEEARKAQLEALEARVAELEAENARLLTGDRPVETLFGSALTVVATDERQGVVGKKAMRKFLGVIDEVVGEPGRHDFGGGVGVWRSGKRDLDVTVREEGGVTTLRVAERIGLVTGAMVGGVLGGGGAVGALFFLMWLLDHHREPVVLIAIPIWLAVMYGVARFALARHVRSRQRAVVAHAIALVQRLPTHTLETETEQPSERS